MSDASPDELEPAVREDKSSRQGRLFRMSGDVTIATAQTVSTMLGELGLAEAERVTLDLSDVHRLDTVGAWVVYAAERDWRRQGIKVSVQGLDETREQLIGGMSAYDKPSRRCPDTGGRLTAMAARIGDATVKITRGFGAFLAFLGAVLIRTANVATQPKKIRWISLSHHIEHAGVNALPIIGLMSFLIGLVIVQQGAYQLRRFGAESFVVNMVGLLTLRELGVLMTAIMVAGRSGSAFTAQIGSMKISEEIDALRTIGIDPVDSLVLPRMIALVLVMPLLAFFADIMTLAGGMVFGWLSLDLGPTAFLEGLRAAVTLGDFWAGLVKAPIFGVIIAVAGCFQGVNVENDAESLGRNTTTSVVVSIFLVIVIDAFFAVFYTVLGI